MRWDDAYHTSDALAVEMGGDPHKRRARRDPLLDVPTPAPQILDLIMSDALTRLYLQANGATMALAERTMNGNRENHGPTADMTCTLLHEEYLACKTNRWRLHVILETQQVATRATTVDRAKVHGSAEWTAAVRADKRSLRNIAAAYGTSKSEVQRIKARPLSQDLRSTQVSRNVHHAVAA